MARRRAGRGPTFAGMLGDALGAEAKRRVRREVRKHTGAGMSGDDARDDAQDWRRVALALAGALDAAHAEIRRLKGDGLPAEADPVPTPVEPTPAPAAPSIMARPLRQRLERLRKIREGATVIGPGPTDSGFAVSLLLDGARVGLVGGFALTKLYSPDLGTWQGQGPLRTVAEWAADGWDITDGGRV